MKKHLLFAILALSFNANAQWVQTNGPFGGQTVVCLATSGSNIFAGTNSGVYISSDNGNVWTAVNNGLTSTFIRSLAISGSNIFAGTNGGGVFLSSDNGSSWTAVNNGLSGFYIFSIITKGTDIFASSMNDGIGGVYISSNNGGLWTPVNNGLALDTFANSYRILGLGLNGNNIFTLGQTTSMYISSDDGGSWASVNNGFQNDGNRFNFAANGSDIFVGNTYGVFYSNNNGGLWTNYNNGLPSNGVTSIAISGSNIFAGTNSGVWLSSNNGALWTNTNTNGIANQNILSFVISGTNIFAGTANSGVWTRPISELTAIAENIEATGFNLYPNPSSGTFTIASNENDYTLIINNVIGENVYQSKIKNQKSEMDLSKQPKGIYFVNIKTEKETVVQKLVISN